VPTYILLAFYGVSILTGNEKEMIRADYLKTWVTTILAIVAGEVTLLNTVYKGSNLLWAFYISVICFILSIVFCLGAYEGLVNKIAGVPSVNNKLLKLWAKTVPKTDESVWVLSSIGGLLIGLGVVFAVLFFFLTMQ